MSNEWIPKKRHDEDENTSPNKDNWEGYTPFLRPIKWDKGSTIIRSGQAKYSRTKSLFGPQKKSGQIMLNFIPPKKI